MSLPSCTLDKLQECHTKDRTRSLIKIGRSSKGIIIDKNKLDNEYKTDTFDIYYVNDAIVLFPVDSKIITPKEAIEIGKEILKDNEKESEEYAISEKRRWDF